MSGVIKCDECYQECSGCACANGPTIRTTDDRAPYPWCGARQTDLWEIGSDTEDTTYECDACNKTIAFSRYVSVTHTLRRGSP